MKNKTKNKQELIEENLSYLFWSAPRQPSGEK